MKRSYLIASALFFSLGGFAIGFASATYSDVSSSDWYYDSVMNLSEYGIVEGYSDNTYNPSAYVNRAELATMLDRALTMLKEDACVDGEDIYFDGDLIDRGGYTCYCDGGEIGMCTGAE